MTSRSDEALSKRRPLATPAILILISAAHLAYGPIANLRDIPVLPPALAASSLLGAGYAALAWLTRRERRFRAAFSLIIGENLGVLAAGLLLGYPWVDYLLPGVVVILALQLALAFAEIIRRQEAGQPIVAAARLAWFVLASSLALAAYIYFQPGGLWTPAS